GLTLFRIPQLMWLIPACQRSISHFAALTGFRAGEEEPQRSETSVNRLIFHRFQCNRGLVSTASFGR
ncbi:hypothetical protein, partial [Bradyrhizobium sp.]|uniref:hypothetical protein n=1 Tax=Bradyrhizobium sp. TaxID=376 RepID=UPI003C42DE81